MLAAGTSSRFKGSKVLAKIGGMTLLERVVASVPPGMVGETLVVLGHGSEAVRKGTELKGTRVVVNLEFEKGMSTSIAKGVGAISRNAPGVLVLLADQPFLTRPLLARMLRAFAERPRGVLIVAAGYLDLVAPPAIFARELFGDLEKLKGDQGARAVIEANRDSLLVVKVRKWSALADVDTREDLRRARRLVEKREPR